MSTKQYSVGEIAKSTGLTVRTLQHYDNIGLLPASGRTEGGRRFYTEADLVKLTQVVFYRSLGIPLEDIKLKQIETPTLPQLKQTLEGHYTLLMKKIDALHLAMSVMESSLAVIQSGHYPPFEMLTKLIRTVDGSSLSDWMGFGFSQDLLGHLEESGIATLSGAMEFYHAIREMMVEAATLSDTGVSPQDERSQELAKRWWEWITSMVGGNEKAFGELMQVNKDRATWPQADRLLFETAEPYLEACLEQYFILNQINVPEAFMKQEGQV